MAAPGTSTDQPGVPATREDLVREYRALVDEDRELRTAARHAGGDLTPAQTDRVRAVRARLRVLGRIPPPGYTLPKAALVLLEEATACGWDTGVQWTAPDWDGEPSVQVGVRRILAPEEAAEHRFDRWVYTLTWHSRGCAPGRVRLFSGLAQTPDNPRHHDAPSVKAIRAVIAAHPAPGASAA